MAYYLVKTKKMREPFEELQEQYTSRHKAYKKVLKQTGANGGYLSDKSGLMGLTFKKAPDSCLWCKVRGIDDAYRPRRNKKATKELQALFHTIPFIKFDPINKAIKFDPWKMMNSIGGRICWHPAVHCIADDVWVFHLPEYTDEKYKPPQGIIEITNTKYEELKAKHKKPRRKKKV